MKTSAIWAGRFLAVRAAARTALAAASRRKSTITVLVALFLLVPLGMAVDAGAQDEQAAQISIDDVTMPEGDSGQTAFRFNRLA